MVNFPYVMFIHLLPCLLMGLSGLATDDLIVQVTSPPGLDADDLVDMADGCDICGGFTEITTRNIIQCDKLCQRHSDCQAADYNVRTRLCVPLNRCKYTSGCEGKAEWKHITIGRSSTQNGSQNLCQSQPCDTFSVCAVDATKRSGHGCLPIRITRNGPLDCSDVQKSGATTSGVYTIYPYGNGTELAVFCDMETNGGGWLVFQKRQNGLTDFYRTWADYENGFGDINQEFWLGNRVISYMTTNERQYMLRIDLEDFENEMRFAEYNTFHISGPETNYSLGVDGYHGDAGDSMSHHNGRQFTTKDVDNDAYGTNCANKFKGAWWYIGCHQSNLNGLYLGGNHASYADGIEWNGWKGLHYSYKIAEMKFRPR